jgi:hypothetical protein
VSAAAVILWVGTATLAFAVSTGLAGLSTALGLVALLSFLHLGVFPSFCAPVAGALFGFLPFHLPAPRLLTGKAGRLVLGFTLATLTLLLPPDRNVPLALGLMAYPLVDLGLSLLRRFVRGKPLLLADDGSVHLRLQRYLWGSEGLALALVTAMAGLIAVTGIHRANVWFIVVLLALAALLALVLVALGRIESHGILGFRRRFRHLHLVRDYVTRRLSLASSVAEVERSLRVLLEDLPLAWVCLGPWHLENGGAGDPALVREEAEVGDQVASWGYLPPPGDPPALRSERHGVVVEVLAAADHRLAGLVA